MKHEISIALFLSIILLATVSLVRNLSYRLVSTQLPQTQTAAVADFDSSLVAHYTFDDGTAIDSSGRGNNGTVNGAIPTPGKSGQALSFDGVDDYVNAGSGASLDDISQISLSVWVNGKSYGQSSQGYLINKSSFGAAGWLLQYIVTGDSLRFKVDYTTTDLNVEATGVASTWNTWTHWVVTWDGSTTATNVHIYKNGTEVSYSVQTNGVGTRNTDAAQNLLIGNNTIGSATRTFDGSIDDVRIYNRALSPTEVFDIYSQKITEASNPLPSPIPIDTGQESSFFYIRSGATSLLCTDWINACDSLPATLKRGATYYISDGLYPGYTFDDPVLGSQYITIKKATQGDHGTNIGWNDSYGDGIAQWIGTIMFKASYFKLDGVVGGSIRDWASFYGFKISSTDNIIFVMFSDKYGAPKDRIDVSHIDISHIELAGRTPVTPGWGTGFDASTYLARTSDVTISNCYVHDIGDVPFRWISANNIIVDSCYIARNATSPSHHGVGFRMDNVDGLTLRNSLFEDIVGTGFVGGYDIGVKNISIYGNVFSWSPLFHGETAFSETKDNSGNTVFTPSISGGGGNGVIFSIFASGPIENWKIYNNTFVHLPYVSPLINLYNSVGSNEAYNNLFFDYDGYPSFNGVTSHDYNYFGRANKFPGISNELHGQDGGTIDPFVSSINKDFRLLFPTKPGKVLFYPYNVDPAISTRGIDGTWDIGAYEYTGSVSTNPLPQTPPTTKPGDFNSDGAVNTLDFSLMVAVWNQSSPLHDLNKDGMVNSLDFSILVQNWTR